jgi:hypothetical protein
MVEGDGEISGYVVDGPVGSNHCRDGETVPSMFSQYREYFNYLSIIEHRRRQNVALKCSSPVVKAIVRLAWRVNRYLNEQRRRL